MAANMDTKMVKEIMTEFETQENGTTVPSKVLDAVHEVITGKNDKVIDYCIQMIPTKTTDSPI